MDEKILLRYDNTLDDFVAFNDFHHANSPGLKRIRMLARWLGALAIFCVAAREGGIPGIIGGMVGAGMFAVIYPLLMRRALRRQVRMMYSEGQNKGYLGEHELEICDDGIIGRSLYHEAKVAWGAIERVETTPDYTFIYVGSLMAHVIPHKRILEGDYKAFLAQFGQRFQSDRKLQRSTSPPIVITAPEQRDEEDRSIVQGTARGKE